MRSSEIAHPGPTTSYILYWFGWLYFKIMGWDTLNEPPQVTKAVLIAAPHTTNWDLPHMLAASWVFRFKISWMGKRSLFWGPFGVLFRFLGGIPVDRHAPGGLVKQVAEQLKRADRLVIAVPPAGTRGHRDRWKSGFYWIAHTAEVPVVCGYLDFKTKRASLGHTFEPSGDVVKDMNNVRKFFEGVEGKFPESQSTIVLKEELALTDAEQA